MNPRILAPYFRQVVSNITWTSNPKRILTANPNRVGLFVCNDAQAGVMIGLTSAISAQIGIGMVQTGSAGSVLSFTFGDWGPMVGSEWWANTLSGNGSLYVVENIYEPPSDT